MSIAILLTSLVHAQADVPPADSYPVVEEMPDPFLFQDGRRVESVDDWQERRAEMLELVLSIQYGHVPPAPDTVEAEVLDAKQGYGGGFAHETLRLTMHADKRLATTVHLYLPGDDGPYPVIVRFGIDTGVARHLLKRGYAYACFEHRELDADTEGYDCPGPAQMLYPDYDWGSIAVWAWGASRVLDYLETRDEVNTEHAVVTGHSRTGKAALLAGVLDERFALVVPNGSGCGGAAAYRNPPDGVETLKLITLPSRWKAWLQKDFGRFGMREERLPFDQHFMRALIAPRVILSTDGLDDTWANPPGTQRAWLAAQPVFEFLNVPTHNLCHFREGGHDQLPPDYDVLLDVADWLFRDKPLTRDFSTLPEPGMKPGRTWKAPEAGR